MAAAKKDINEPIENGKTGLYTEETYNVVLPITKDKQDDVFVSVNGMTYQIQRGKEVEVPASVYEVLMNSQKMDMLALERMRALASKSNH